MSNRVRESVLGFVFGGFESTCITLVRIVDLPRIASDELTM